MANIGFARKYRPAVISEYLGDRVKNAILKRFKEPDSYPQVILMTGSSGCGKTSAARIMTKEVHCMDKKDGKACGQCEMCLTIEEEYIQKGNPIEGIQEIDLAADSGKADIEGYLSDAMDPPLWPIKYKILILDECHMATKQTQNLLLKICEEPPKHLIFIFCTTDPENLLGTLKGRCQFKLEVKKPSVDELANRMLEICEKEKIVTSIEALRIVAKASGRTPREALSLLEEIAIENNNQVLVDMVSRHVGSVGTDIYIKYIQAANKGIGAILRFNNDLKESDIPPKKFMVGLTRFILDCLYVRHGVGLDQHPESFVKTAKKLFEVYTEDEIDLLLQIVEHGMRHGLDDAKAELILTTTASRIGKVKILTKTLEDERNEAEKENTESYKNYIQTQQEEKQLKNRVREVDVTDNLLGEVFGKNLVELDESQKHTMIPVDKYAPLEDTDTTNSEEEMIRLLMGE